MATKNLSRTVIEGGRYYFNSDERRRSHGEARRETNASMAALAHDPSRADDALLPRTKPVGVAQRDNLAAAERWLRSHVGRPWWKVEGEIRAAFDTRTIAGQHIVFDHLLPRGYPQWPDGSGEPGWRVHRRWRFSVDPHGILRAKPVARYSHRWTPQAGPRVKAWLAGRRVRVWNDERYWLVPTGSVRGDGFLAYRQGPALDAFELRFFRSLPAHEQIYATVLLTTRAERLDELVRVGATVIAAGAPSIDRLLPTRR
jgi:hypothetical protein